MKPTPNNRELSLISSGEKKIQWARNKMPLLRRIKQRFADKRPFEGLSIGVCLHIEAKTGVWLETLTAGGAKIIITGSPRTTQKDVAAAIAIQSNIQVIGRICGTYDEHLKNINEVLSLQPNILVDNGADLIMQAHNQSQFNNLVSKIIGATEETTSGSLRLQNDLRQPFCPTIIINDCELKQVIENRYGVGQSVVSAIMSSTNLLLGGRKAVVVGYGSCGRGIALRLRGLGAHVLVVETEPIKALEAHLEGYKVLPLSDAIESGDFIITVTGHSNILQQEHFSTMKDGVLVCNAGHFEFEINKTELLGISVSHGIVRENIEVYTLRNGNRIFLIADGNLVNLVAGDGNPIEVMDIGLALQSLSLEYLVKQRNRIKNSIYQVPYSIQCELANLAFLEWSN